MPIRRVLAAAAAALVLAGGLAATAHAAGAGGVALGLASVFGPGAAARSDPAAALYTNPALAARLDGPAAWSCVGIAGGLDVARAAVSLPLRSGPTLALGYAGEAGTAGPDAIHLGAARLLPAALAAGVTLQLQTEAEAGGVERSFGIDVGMHWQSALGGAPGRFATGLVLAGLDRQERVLRAGAAWTGRLGRAWSAGASAGVEGSADHRRLLAFGGFLSVGRAELAAGVDDGFLRVGGAAQAGAWHLAYTYSDGDGTHGAAVRWRFGPSREESRRAQERARELEIAGRVHALAEEVETSRLVAWQQAGARALAGGRFAEAESWYGAMLAARPGDGQAQQGLLRARHAAWVSSADSLLGQHDTVGAARALEQALLLMPADTTSAQRLQELRHAAHSADQTRDATSRLFDEAVQAYAQQRHQDAVRGFDAVLRLDPKHPTASSYRKLAQSAHELTLRSALRSARGRLEAGDLAAASSHVRRVLDAEPRHQEALQLMERIEKRAKPVTPPKPVAHEDAAPAVPAFVPQRYQDGMQRFRSDDFVGAMRAWEEVSRAAPHYAEVDQYLLRVYRMNGIESYTEGRLHEAVDSFQKGLSLEPDNVQLRRYLNSAQAKLARTQASDTPER